MSIDAALVKEQGVHFAVVAVKAHVLNNSSQSNEVQRGFQARFPGYNIVLMAQDSQGVPTYYGRRDIVRFLSNTHISQLPWKRYSSN